MRKLVCAALALALALSGYGSMIFRNPEELVVVRRA
jgi:hypothetical protein